MINIFWEIMTKFTELLLPCIAIYILFDLTGALLFNKR